MIILVRHYAVDEAVDLALVAVSSILDPLLLTVCNSTYRRRSALLSALVSTC